MTALNQRQREDLRHAVLYFLGERPRLALSADSLPRFLHRGGLLEAEPDVVAVEDALRVLQSMELVEELVNPLGASLSYRVTGKGLLQHERNRKEP